MGLEANLKLRLAWVFEQLNDLSTPKDDDLLSLLTTLTAGSGTNQINQMFLDRRTVSAASGTDVLDLAGGLYNSFGQVCTFSAIKLLLVKNRGTPLGTDPQTWTVTDGQDLLVGGVASGAWRSLFNGVASSVLRVPADGLLLLTAPTSGFIVGAGSHDLLQVAFAGSGPHIDYDIVLLGVQ
jgi:hypothetical protein